MAEQRNFITKLFSKNPIDEEVTRLQLVEKAYADDMSTSNASTYLSQRFGIFLNESKIVSRNDLVSGGLVSKTRLKNYALAFKKTNARKYASKYPFKYIDENGKAHKEGYSI
jgi:hypothetical protein